MDTSESSRQLTQGWEKCTGIPTICHEPKNKEDICFSNLSSAMTHCSWT
jgi:hypothetical protein